MSEEHDKDPAGYPLTHSYEDQMRSIGEGRLSSLANCVAEEIKRLKARAEKAEEENKSLIVKKSARENLLMEALLQGSAAGVSFAGTALNDWLDHAKRLPPHQFVSFEDSLSRETSFLARAEKAEAELKNFREVKLMAALPVSNVKTRQFSRIEEAEAELAERDKALEEAIEKCGIGQAQGMPPGYLAADDGIAWKEEETPELAEWLRNREK